MISIYFKNIYDGVAKDLICWIVEKKGYPKSYIVVVKTKEYME